jgi:hypothetical protein
MSRVADEPSTEVKLARRGDSDSADCRLAAWFHCRYIVARNRQDPLPVAAGLRLPELVFFGSWLGQAAVGFGLYHSDCPAAPVRRNGQRVPSEKGGIHLG